MLLASDVDALLAACETEYSALLTTVLAACEEVERDFGDGVIRDIYSRADKQAKSDLARKSFKAPDKIAKAMSANGHTSVSDVDDVIGITVVVYYADQIPTVLAAVRSNLAAKRIKVQKEKVRRLDGYYATHVVVLSDHTKHRGRRCEVQFKTMLHDAWAAKTHDLVYKPQGRHDRRLDRLMNTFAEALQAIEVQSETLRELIEERWASEEEWRRLLREQLFGALPGWLAANLSTDGQSLRDDISAARNKLLGCKDENDLVQDLAARVDHLSKTSLREGFMLEVYLAISNDRPAAWLRAEQRTYAWLQIAELEYNGGRAHSHDVWSVPLILYICGNLPKAIEIGSQLMAESKLTGRDKEALAFNLANHLIENAYFSLPEDESQAVDLKNKVEDLIASAHSLRSEDETAFLDTEGMKDVAFSRDPSEVRKAIDLIHRGNENVQNEEVDIARAYFELHIRLGWRRLLELETAEIKRKLSSPKHDRTCGLDDDRPKKAPVHSI